MKEKHEDNDQEAKREKCQFEGTPGSSNCLLPEIDGIVQVFLVLDSLVDLEEDVEHEGEDADREEWVVLPAVLFCCPILQLAEQRRATEKLRKGTFVEKVKGPREFLKGATKKLV